MRKPFYQVRFGDLTNSGSNGWVGIPIEKCGHAHKSPEAAAKMEQSRPENRGGLFNLF